jgi:hypothetical protein
MKVLMTLFMVLFMAFTVQAQQLSYKSGEYVANKGMFTESTLIIKEQSPVEAFVKFDGAEPEGHSTIQMMCGINGDILYSNNGETVITIKVDIDKSVHAIVKSKDPSPLQNQTYHKVK